jgi:hypothetical protein
MFRSISWRDAEEAEEDISVLWALENIFEGRFYMKRSFFVFDPNSTASNEWL